MAQNTRDLRRRIKSTKSIRQITKAMEMIAASKMRKAQLAALASRPYAVLAWEMLSSLQGIERGDVIEKLGARGKMLREPEQDGGKSLVVLITSNRGLCGSLNSQLVNEAWTLAKENKENFVFVSVGRKGTRALSRLGLTMRASFDGFENQPTTQEIWPIADVTVNAFLAEDFSRVFVLYADFISTLQYKVRVRQLLPITAQAVVYSGGVQLEIGKHVETKKIANDLLFEPNPEDVLGYLLPRLTELQLYQLILENMASEHSARMINMKNASDSARDLISDLTLTYNSLRQASITADLADIIGGRMAVK